MGILLLVTGIAVGGRALIGIIDVAGSAGDFLVFSFELEGGQVVIELRRCPASLIMAVSAAKAEAAAVRLVLLMAGVAVLQGD